MAYPGYFREHNGTTTSTPTGTTTLELPYTNVETFSLVFILHSVCTRITIVFFTLRPRCSFEYHAPFLSTQWLWRSFWLTGARHRQGGATPPSHLPNDRDDLCDGRHCLGNQDAGFNTLILCLGILLFFVSYSNFYQSFWHLVQLFTHYCTSYLEVDCFYDHH